MKFEECLSYLTDERWGQCSVEKKMEILSGIEKEIAFREKRLPCMLNPYREPPQKDGGISLGLYSRNTKDISINTFQLEHGSKYGDNYRIHLDTVLHEGRHAYQDQAVSGYVDEKNKELLEKWRQNMEPGHYISPKQNYLGYYRQPVESDAREYALRLGKQLESEKINLEKSETLDLATNYSRRSQKNNEDKVSTEMVDKLRDRYRQKNNEKQDELTITGKSDEKAAKVSIDRSHKSGWKL